MPAAQYISSINTHKQKPVAEPRVLCVLENAEDYKKQDSGNTEEACDYSGKKVRGNADAKKIAEKVHQEQYYKAHCSVNEKLHNKSDGGGNDSQKHITKQNHSCQNQKTGNSYHACSFQKTEKFTCL